MILARGSVVYRSFVASTFPRMCSVVAWTHISHRAPRPSVQNLGAMIPSPRPSSTRVPFRRSSSRIARLLRSRSLTVEPFWPWTTALFTAAGEIGEKIDVWSEQVARAETSEVSLGGFTERQAAQFAEMQAAVAHFVAAEAAAAAEGGGEKTSGGSGGSETAGAAGAVCATRSLAEGAVNLGFDLREGGNLEDSDEEEEEAVVRHGLSLESH
eukprot:956717-Prorocentrum_minimum.AAC.1